MARLPAVKRNKERKQNGNTRAHEEILEIRKHIQPSYILWEGGEARTIAGPRLTLFETILAGSSCQMATATVVAWATTQRQGDHPTRSITVGSGSDRGPLLLLRQPRGCVPSSPRGEG